MACNCKRIKRFEDTFGIPEEESILSKVMRIMSKVLLFLIAIGLTIVIAPCITLIAIYKIVWGKDNRIVLPKFIRKYME